MGRRLAHAGAIGWAARWRESRGVSVDLGGTTLTPIARVHGLGLRIGPAAVLAGRAAPARVELRGPDGTRSDIAVTDLDWRLRQLSVMLAALLIIITLLGRLR